MLLPPLISSSEDEPPPPYVTRPAQSVPDGRLGRQARPGRAGEKRESVLRRLVDGLLAAFDERAVDVLGAGLGGLDVALHRVAVHVAGAALQPGGVGRKVGGQRAELA